MGWRKYLRRADEDAELAREIEAHISHEIDESLARGMTAEEARRRALVKFGSARNVREDVWEWNTVGLLDDLWRNLRYVVRTLRRAPGFALAVILVMALGIGSVTAMFTIVRSVLLKPLPFGDRERLVMLYERSPLGQYPYNVVAGGIFAEWEKETKSFEQMALFRGTEYNLSGSGGQLPEQIVAANCSWRFFSVLGVEPVLGRTFDATDDVRNANATVILSSGLWKRRFAGDPAIVGKTIQLDAEAYTVIGVMPGWFSYPNARTQVWTPAYHENDPMTMESRDNHMFRVLALLRPGVPMEQGLSELDTLVKRIRAEHPDQVIGRGANIRPLLEEVVGDYKTPLYVLLGATFCVLVIACLNAASLFVARSAARRREAAIRSALGGGRWRLLWEQVLESTVLSAMGGAIGLELALMAVKWVIRTRPDMARADAIHVDGTVVAFAVGIVLLAGIFAGVVSAISGKREQVLETLQESSRTHSGGQSKGRLRKGLLAIEMGLTVVLLIAAGLLLKSYESLRTTNLGCATKNMVTIFFSLPDARYREPLQRVAFFERLGGEVRHLPGVEKAGLVTWPPGAGYGGDNVFTIPEHPPLPKGEFQSAIRRYADPRYFEAMGVPLLRGRTFRENERLDRASVVIISDLLARECFPHEDPIGRHLRATLDGMNTKDYEIVGVVGDTRVEVTRPVEMMMYFPLYRGDEGYSWVVVRTRLESEGVALAVQKAVAGMDPDLATQVLTMDQVIGQSTMGASFNTQLTLGFAVLSLILASVGLYGVLSYLVAQRTSEIGVRMALGALPGSVLRLTLADGLRPAVLGLVIGLAGGVAAAKLIQDLLYGLQPLDASIFAGVAAILLGVATAACVLPAWRASRLDPARALRSE